MSIIACPECSKEVSNTVEKCPHCGFQIRESGLKTTAKKLLIAVGIVLAIIVFLPYIILAILPENKNQSLYTVISDGKYLIKSQLKDPNSAEFGDVWVGQIDSSDSHEKTLIACGYVNARNGFGGMTGKKRFAGPLIEGEEFDSLEPTWSKSCIAGRIHE